MDLIYRHALNARGMYEEMELVLDPEILDMFHVLFMCAVDVSLCIDMHHPLRGLLARFRSLTVPDERQLHRYGEMTSDESHFVSMRPNDFSMLRHSWIQLPHHYSVRATNVREWLANGKATLRVVTR